MPSFATAWALGNQTSLVTKHRYLDYRIIRNATCPLTWAFIGVLEGFLRRERVRENAIY